jgi:membrane protein
VTRPPSGSRPPGLSRRSALLRLVLDVRRGLRGHDMWLLAGGLTFYAAIAVVPLLLLALYLAGLLVGAETVRALALDLVRFAPESMGFAQGLEELADVGPSLGVTAALAALVPATSYGEGLLRAFDRLGGRKRSEGRVWRGRLRSFALLALLPGLVMVGLLATAALPEIVGRGPGARVLGVWATFWVGWVSSSILLCLTYRGFVPEPLGARALF